MYKRVLVTGGSGFVAKALRKVKPQWDYISSSDCDLTNRDATYRFLKDLRPEAIIHLAGKVGGIRENSEKQAEFYYTNVLINTNVINEAKNVGIKRVLSSLSTCCFPDKLKEYPFVEEDIFSGAPATTNLSYGFAKRALFVQSCAYRKQHDLNYSCFSPSNLYGPGDNFEDDNSHFVPALIRKVAAAQDQGTVKLWGTGKALRQQLYVEDLAQIIPLLLEGHNSECPLIVAPDENLSIKEMADLCVQHSGKSLHLLFNGKLSGQHRKDGNNQKLKQLIGDFKFTPFDTGLLKTYNWYRENK